MIPLQTVIEDARPKAETGGQSGQIEGLSDVDRQGRAEQHDEDVEATRQQKHAEDALKEGRREESSDGERERIKKDTHTDTHAGSLLFRGANFQSSNHDAQRLILGPQPPPIHTEDLVHRPLAYHRP